jgi:hypothetical protein
MNGYQIYQYYSSIKLHFTSNNYDVFANKGKTKTSYSAYLSRKDYKLFEAVSKYFKSDMEVIQFTAANIAYGYPNFIYAIDDGCVDNYLLFLKRKQSLTNVFKDDLAKIEWELDKGETNLFEFKDGEIPLTFRMFMGGFITIETMNILNKMFGFLDIEYPMFQKEFLRIKKLSGFVEYDLDKLKNVYRQSSLLS